MPVHASKRQVIHVDMHPRSKNVESNKQRTNVQNTKSLQGEDDMAGYAKTT